jgi:hypothetical protein
LTVAVAAAAAAAVGLSQHTLMSARGKQSRLRALTTGLFFAKVAAPVKTKISPAIMH